MLITYGKQASTAKLFHTLQLHSQMHFCPAYSMDILIYSINSLFPIY